MSSFYWQNAALSIFIHKLNHRSMLVGLFVCVLMHLGWNPSEMLYSFVSSLALTYLHLNFHHTRFRGNREVRVSDEVSVVELMWQSAGCLQIPYSASFMTRLMFHFPNINRNDCGTPKVCGASQMESLKPGCVHVNIYQSTNFMWNCTPHLSWLSKNWRWWSSAETQLSPRRVKSSRTYTSKNAVTLLLILLKYT